MNAHATSRPGLRLAAETLCAEFDALLNAQWVEGYSAAEVERLAEFREKFVEPLRRATVVERGPALCAHSPFTRDCDCECGRDYRIEPCLWPDCGCGCEPECEGCRLVQEEQS